MRLWTWQDRRLNLADRGRISNLQYSRYTTNCLSSLGGAQRHRKAYEKLFSRLNNDQLIWCFQEYADAVSDTAILEFQNVGCLLWEIDVPDERIQWYCHAAWTCLRGQSLFLPDGLSQTHEQLARGGSHNAQMFKHDFTTYWSEKDENGLFDFLFLGNSVSGCSGAIVFHPVGTILRDPLQRGEWWSKCPGRNLARSPLYYAVPLPCRECPGRQAI
jgi:hypothetical protein